MDIDCILVLASRRFGAGKAVADASRRFVMAAFPYSIVYRTVVGVRATRIRVPWIPLASLPAPR